MPFFNDPIIRAQVASYRRGTRYINKQRRRRRRLANKKAYNYIGKRTVPMPSRTELKKATDGVVAQRIGTLTVATMVANIVVPLIAEGTSDTQRDGNIIKPYRLNLKILMSHRSTSVSDIIRVAVLREVYYGAVTTAAYIPTYTELANALLLLNENSTAVAIAGSNDPARMLYRWNDKIVRPYRDKVLTGNVRGTENDIKLLSYSLKLKKNFVYKGSAANDCISPRIFFICYCADRIAIDTPTDDQFEVQMISTLYYTDV